MTKVRIISDDDLTDLIGICDALSKCANAICELSDNSITHGDVCCTLLNATMKQRATFITVLIDDVGIQTVKVVKWFFGRQQFVMVVEWPHGATTLTLRTEEDQQVHILPADAFVL